MSTHVPCLHVLRSIAWLTGIVWLGACLAVGFSGQENITAGQTANLSCQVSNNTHITVVEWKRPDIKDEYVLLYRDEQFDPEEQHLSFKNGVELQDRRMKDGDVSLILKNVTTADSGTYECRIFIKGVVMDGHPICTINLSVHPPGQLKGHNEGVSVGLIAGLSGSGLAVAVAVGAVIYRRYKKQKCLQLNGSGIKPPGVGEL